MEQSPLLAHIKEEPPENDPDYTEEPTPDPLQSEIKLEPVEVQLSEPVETSNPEDPEPVVKIVSSEILKTIKPKPGLRRMQLACGECGKVCSSAGFLRRHKQYCNPKNADGLIPCKLCPAAFKKVIRLKYHMNTHEGNKAFKCRNEGCQEAFYFPETRYNHEEDCRNKEPSTCTICGATFQFSRSLRSHMKLHEPPRFECQICNKKFFHRKNLQTHWLTHFKDKAEAARAGGQAMKTSNEAEEDDSPDEEEPEPENMAVSEVKPNIKETGSQEDSGKIYFCELCGKNFPLEEYLTRHKEFCTGFIPVQIDAESASRNAENLSCSVCGKKEESVESLKTHMVQHEKGRYKCTVCDRDFGSKAILKRHSSVHSDERNHPCDVCGKPFKTKRAKAKHTKYMHTAPQKLSCEVCTDTFSNSHSLRYHMNKHTGDRPYKCRTEGCNEAFHQPNGRQRHEEHCGKEPKKLQCTLCGASLKSKKCLTVHMLGHEARFECELCGKRFGQNFRLRAHMEKAHGSTAGGQPSRESGEEEDELESADETEDEGGMSAVKQEPEDE